MGVSRGALFGAFLACSTSAANAAIPFVGSLLGELQGGLQSAAAIGQSNLNIASRNEYQLLQSMVDSLNSQLTDQRNALISQLTKEQREILLSVQSDVEDFQKGLIQNESVLQAKSLRVISQVEYWHKLPFLVTGIEGLSQVRNPSGYDVQIIGIGFGTDEGNRTFDPSVVVGSSVIPATDLHRTSDGLRVHIPAVMLDGQFSDDAVQSTKLVLSSDVAETCGVLHFGKCHSKYTTSFDISLLPRNAAHAIMTSFKSTVAPDLSTQQPAQTPPGSIQTCDANYRPNCSVDTGLYVPPPGWIVTAAKWVGCDGAGCAYKSGEACPISQDGRSAYCHVLQHGSAVTRYYQFWIAQTLTNSTASAAVPVTLAYDKFSTITYPASASLVRLDGSTSYGQPFSIELVPNSVSAVAPFRCNLPNPPHNGLVDVSCIAVLPKS